MLTWNSIEINIEVSLACKTLFERHDNMFHKILKNINIMFCMCMYFYSQQSQYMLIIATFILIIMPQLTTWASSVTDWLYIVMLYTVKYNVTMPNKICIRVAYLCMHNLCEWWNQRQLQSPVICIYVYKNMQRLPNLKWKSEINLTLHF